MIKLKNLLDEKKFLEIGKVESFKGQLVFCLMVHPDGTAHVTINGSDPTDRRKAAVMVMLTGAEYQKLWKLLQKTDDVIAEAKAAGQMTGLASWGNFT